MSPPKPPLFHKLCLIGIGHIGASIAQAARHYGLAQEIVAGDTNPEHCRLAVAHKVVDAATPDLAAAVKGADLVIFAVPTGAMAAAAQACAASLEPGAIVSDVGSVKQAVIRAISPLLPGNVHFIPAHPIAGTEHSGPLAGVTTLFQGRWCILTPFATTDAAALAKYQQFWQGMGAKMERMEAAHHDKVLAITSHLPHLIAYTIIATASDLGDQLQAEIIRFSAGGFRDFTRVAASDPTMWRDVFLNNREAVLEIVQRFSEDLTALQRAIRWGEGDTLYTLFHKSRAIRKSVIDSQQDTDPQQPQTGHFL